MVARDAGIEQSLHSFFVYQSQRGAEADGSMPAQVSCRVADALQKLAGGAFPADDDREASDALCFVQSGLAQAFVFVYQVICLGLRAVSCRLGTPLAIFGALSRTCIDNGAEVCTPVCQSPGYLMGRFIECFLVGMRGQGEGFRRGDVLPLEDFFFQVLYLHKGFC